ncbi:MAG TPA: hypothetical protein VFK80_08125, partial [Limnochordia bacterium]|nr:hypothetical protein [Limnochordia bacterium]
AARGALFLSDLAVLTGLSRSHAVAALWELTAAGAVTNDRFEPLRRVAAGFRPPSPAMLPPVASSAAPSRSVGPLRLGRPGGYRRRDRAVAERVRAQVDAEAIFSGGRWQLTPPGARALLRPAGDDASPEVMRWWLDTLLRRYGLIARELVQWEGQGPLWPALRRACEAEVWRGALVRAYFTRALSGPQFVTPEAFELARRPAEQATAARDGRAAIMNAGPEAAIEAEWRVLSACDPAAAGRTRLVDAVPGLARDGGHYVVCAGDEALLLAEGQARALYPLVPADDVRLVAALAHLGAWLLRPGAERAVRRLEVRHWAGRPVAGSEGEALLRAAGFQPAAGRMLLWPSDVLR